LEGPDRGHNEIHPLIAPFHSWNIRQNLKIMGDSDSNGRIIEAAKKSIVVPAPLTKSVSTQIESAAWNQQELDGPCRNGSGYGRIGLRDPPITHDRLVQMVDASALQFIAVRIHPGQCQTATGLQPLLKKRGRIDLPAMRQRAEEKAPDRVNGEPCKPSGKGKGTQYLVVGGQTGPPETHQAPDSLLRFGDRFGHGGQDMTGVAGRGQF